MPDKKTAVELPALALKPREEDRLLAGHLWVFSNELQSVPRDVEPGSLAVVKTAKGRVLGMRRSTRKNYHPELSARMRCQTRRSGRTSSSSMANLTMDSGDT